MLGGGPYEATTCPECGSTMWNGRCENPDCKYTHTTDGYLIRKVKETGPQWERFEFVHRTVWEEHNGPVPEGKMVSFLDGNKDNCNIENLVLIDNEENLEMNRSRLRFADPERTKTGVLVAKARVTVRQKKRRK